MFNLLPKHLKDKITSEYKLRRVVVVLLFVLFIQFLFIIFLIPSWLIAYYNESALTQETAQIKVSTAASNTAPITTLIQSINQKLSIINTALEYPKVVPIVDQILSYKTNDVKITEITYVASSGINATIGVHGVASTRESLLSFFKLLQGNRAFTKVELPISNFAKDKNIDFNLNIDTVTQ